MSSLWTGVLCVLVAMALYQSLTPTTVEILTEMSISADKIQIFKFLCNLTKVLEQKENMKVVFIGSVVEDGSTIDQYQMTDSLQIYGSLSYPLKYVAFQRIFQENSTISTEFEVPFGLTQGKTTWSLYDATEDGSQVTSNLKEQFMSTNPWIFSHYIQMVVKEEHRKILVSVKERMEAKIPK